MPSVDSPDNSITPLTGVWGGAVGMVILGYLDDNVHAAIIFYVVVVALSCCTNVSGSVNHMDLSPNYAGVLMGMSNGVAACGGLLAPLMVAYFVTDIVSIAVLIYLFFFTQFVLFKLTFVSVLVTELGHSVAYRFLLELCRSFCWEFILCYIRFGQNTEME